LESILKTHALAAWWQHKHTTAGKISKMTRSGDGQQIPTTSTTQNHQNHLKTIHIGMNGTMVTNVGTKKMDPRLTTLGKPPLLLIPVQVPDAAAYSSTEEEDGWSDPESSGRRTPTSVSVKQQPHSRAAPQGIQIPFFLQPLLGLDFVPYLPEHQSIDENGEQEEEQSEADLLTEGELEELYLPRQDVSLDIALKQPTTEGGGGGEPPVGEITTTAGEIVTSSREKKGKPKRRLSMPNFFQGGRRRAHSKDSLTPTSTASITPRNRLRAHSKDSLTPTSTASITPRNRLRSFASLNASWSGQSLPENDEEPDIPITERVSHVTHESAPPQQLEWLQKQHHALEGHQSHLGSVQSEALAMHNRTLEINERIGEVQYEILQLQQALKRAEKQLHGDLGALKSAKSEMAQLETTAVQAAEAVVNVIKQMRIGALQLLSDQQVPTTLPPRQYDDSALLDGSKLTPKITNGVLYPRPLLVPPQPPLRQRAATAPLPSLSTSSSFMRVHDLEMTASRDDLESSNHESSSISSSSHAGEFFFIDHDMTIVLDNLARLGYEIATDEGERFTPTRDTERLLNKYRNNNKNTNNNNNNSNNNNNNSNNLKNWPVEPWQVVMGTDVLVWVGGVDHNGFGSDWPVCKARALVQTSPRELLEYLHDSSKVKQHNKISQGRKDLLIIQDGVDTTAAESSLGFAGDAKIIKSLNKPRLLPKTIEILSLMYSKHVENAPGSYMMVSRSVFEDDSGRNKSTNSTIRSEMLLGVILLRPVDETQQVTEMTTITHVYSPGIPELLAKRAAPNVAANMIGDIQAIFVKK
jgi:hypothetical protein